MIQKINNYVLTHVLIFKILLIKNVDFLQGHYLR